MLQALELLQLAKRDVSGRSNIEIKPIAIAIIKLSLVSKSVSLLVVPSVGHSIHPSVSQSVEILI